MFTNLESDAADDLWLSAVDRFRLGSTIKQESRVGATEELLHAALCLRDPRQRWVVSRYPALNPAFALAEVIWMLRGRNDSAFVTYFNSKLPEFSGEGLELHGAYGHRLRHRMGIDQVTRAYRVLKANPDSRQVVLQIWEAKSDMPSDDGKEVAKDIPCNVCGMLKVRDGRLEWTQIMRSNDIYRGLPYNIVQFTSLHEVMAGWLGLELGHYNHLSDSLHMYENTSSDVFASAKTQCVPNTDSLAASFEETEIIARDLEQLVEKIIDKSAKVDAIMTDYDSLRVPTAWKNIAAVLVAEGMRRRRNMAAMKSAIAQCSNEVFQVLFDRWANRTMVAASK